MKRLICLAVILFLLFPAAVLAEQQSVTAESVPAGDSDTEARAYADKMEKQFDVTILIGDECLDVLHPEAFSIGSNAPAKSPLLQMLGIKDTLSELKRLEKALEQYPAEMFKNIKDDNAQNGIRFLIADQIIENNPDMYSVGYNTCEGGYYNIVLAYMLFTESSVHHEIWHAMELFITTKYPGAFLIWDSLNPPGFRYSNDFTATSYEFDADFFARGYGTVTAGEDRATIAEAVFYSNRNEWFAERPAVKRKLDAMNLALKDTLIIQYNVNTEAIEP